MWPTLRTPLCLLSFVSYMALSARCFSNYVAAIMEPLSRPGCYQREVIRLLRQLFFSAFEELGGQLTDIDQGLFLDAFFALYYYYYHYCYYYY